MLNSCVYWKRSLKPLYGGGGMKAKKGKKVRGDPLDYTYPPIRMTRAAGARNALVMQRHKMEQRGKLDQASSYEDPLQSRRDINHLGLPNAHALDLLRRVNEEVNIPFRPLGMSVSDQLQSVQADPAVQLLSKYGAGGWREFFVRSSSSGNRERPSSAVSSGTVGVGVGVGVGAGAGGGGGEWQRPRPCSATSPGGGEWIQTQPQADKYFNTTQAQVQAQQPRPTNRLAPVPSLAPAQIVQFQLMVGRVEELWAELRMSREDVAFFRRSLCRAPSSSAPSHEHLAELARYIQMLQLHRARTIQVLQCVGVREAVLHRVYDVLAAMHRRFTSRGREELLLLRARSADALLPLAPLGPLGTQSGGQDPLTELKGEDGAAGGFWKNELVAALKDLQLATLEVVRRIQLWRRNLWRPRPFIWQQGQGQGQGQGIDYLAKVKLDMAVLEAPAFVRLLRAVPLGRKDLICVLFADPVEPSATAAAPTTENDAAGSEAPSDPESAVPEPAATQVPDSDSGSVLSDEPSWSSPLRDAFLSSLSEPNRAVELAAAARVVESHDGLLRAFMEEQRALATQGTFIPTLKVFGESGHSQVTAQAQAQAQSQRAQAPIRGPSPIRVDHSAKRSHNQAGSDERYQDDFE